MFNHYYYWILLINLEFRLLTIAWNGVANIEMIKSEKATFAMYIFVTVCIDLDKKKDTK